MCGGGLPWVGGFCLLSTGLAGCETTAPTHSAAVRAALTPADANLATEDYWWNQPGTAKSAPAAFDPLWDACQAEAHARFFTVDRQEYRSGLLTTVPMVSAQVFEPWRADAVTSHDVAESTLGTIRRTVRFEVRKRSDGSFEVTPKVLVERFTSVERRLTAINQYHTAFSGPARSPTAPTSAATPRPSTT